MIRWFASHPTAANLLLVLIFAAGALAAPTLVRETFPDFRPTETEISVVYRGASAADVEDAVCRRLWDGLGAVEGLDELACTAQDGIARAVATMRAGADPRRFIDEVRTEVAAATGHKGVSAMPPSAIAGGPPKMAAAERCYIDIFAACGQSR
jgi:multidrug efflux pump subunit AcrB